MTRRNSFEKWWREYSKRFSGPPGLSPDPHGSAKAAWKARRGVLISHDLLDEILDVLPKDDRGFEVWFKLLQAEQDTTE